MGALDHRGGRGRWLVRGLFGATLLLSSPAWAQDEVPPTEAEAAPVATEEPAAPEPVAPEPVAPVEPRGPRTASSLQLGVGFRYGAMLNDGDLNPWASGLGLDVGYTLPNAIYLGGSFEYFFGTSQQVLGFTATSNIWQLSAEGGYDFGIGQSFVIRPKVGVGVAGVAWKFEGCPSDDEACESINETKAAILPGTTFLFFASKFSLALDVRYEVVLTDPALKGLIFSFGVGF
jgi:opacity protein-like surface antigen